MMRRVVVLALVSALAGCGSSSSSPAPGPGTPAGGGGVSSSSLVICPAAATISIPPVGTLSSIQIVLPAASVSGCVPVTAAASVTAPSTTASAARGLRTQSAAPSSALFYLSVTPSADVSLAGFPGFQVSRPAGFPAGVQYFGALFDPTAGQWTLAEVGPGTIQNGLTLVIVPGSGNLKLLAGKQYTFAIYAVTSAGSTPTPPPGSTPTPPPGSTPTPPPGSTPTPPPGPTPTPTPTPTPVPGSVMVNPGTLSFITTGAAAAQTATVSQNPSSGAIIESDTCSGIATVGPPSSGVYTITPVGAGTCTATFTPPSGAPGTLHISVTTTSFGVQ